MGRVERSALNKKKKRKNNRMWLLLAAGALAVGVLLFSGAFSGCRSRTEGEASDGAALGDAGGAEGAGGAAQETPAQGGETGENGEAAGWQSLYEDPLQIPADTTDTEALKARAAAMQDYAHAAGEDAEPIREPDDNLLLLVNKTHPLSSDYRADDMVTIDRIVTGIGTDETHQMRAEAAKHLNEMFDAAAEDGYDIRLRTGYRSYDYQRSLFDSYAENHGVEEANRYSALPGESEHQTGWCCDLGLEGVALSGFTDTEEARWVVDHAHEYGFILRYPEEKEDVTGYIYESWHIRYVGLPAAAEIYEQGVTLEEKEETFWPTTTKKHRRLSANICWCRATPGRRTSPPTWI